MAVQEGGFKIAFQPSCNFGLIPEQMDHVVKCLFIPPPHKAIHLGMSFGKNYTGVARLCAYFLAQVCASVSVPYLCKNETA